MREIELSAAAARRWDVVIAGSSFAAMFYARPLRERGYSILFLEKGGRISHADQLADRHRERHAHVRQDNSSPYEKHWTVLHQFGGCSNCWWGNTPRLHPNDFRLKSAYGVGADWPIDYETLEPYMVAAEEIMEVAGGGSEHLFPRSKPYPYPAHAQTRAERRLREHDPDWAPMPSARANGGSRGVCCASGACALCPVDVKFTIQNGLDQFDDPNFAVALDAEVRRVSTEAGAARGLIVRGGDGAEYEVQGDSVALAANAISNAAIMLRSGLGGPLVGQGLHEQASQFAWFNIPFDNYYGGTSITGAGFSLYDGDFRREAGSILIESWNAPPSLRYEKGKWLQRMKLKFVAEDLPRPENRVVLDDDEAKVAWAGHSDYAFAGLARARTKIFDLIPFEHELTAFSGYQPTEAHIQGGTPMSTTAAEGVVDADCRVFGVEGLRCLGSGVFTTCAASNPTLTLAAISLRAGERA